MLGELLVIVGVELILLVSIAATTLHPWQANGCPERALFPQRSGSGCFAGLEDRLAAAACRTRAKAASTPVHASIPRRLRPSAPLSDG